jgi:hypothetical protein
MSVSELLNALKDIDNTCDVKYFEQIYLFQNTVVPLYKGHLFCNEKNCLIKGMVSLGDDNLIVSYD